MAWKCNLNCLVQWCSILVSCYGIGASVASMILFPSLGGVILYAFVILFCVMILFTEIYVCPLFKYATFIITFWGKGVLYLFIGFFLFSLGDIWRIISACIFWAMFGFYIAVHFITKSASPPLCQKGSAPSFEVTNEDYYEDRDAGGGGGGGKTEEV